MSSSLPDADDILDSLYRSQRAAAFVEKKAQAAKALKATAKPETLETQFLFACPDNWVRTRGIALIHAETQTLLGNFSEYTHKTVSNCRRLLREDSPISVSATEQVSGNWWLPTEYHPEPKQVWHTQRSAVIHLHLSKLAVHAPACEVVAHLSYGGLARVELAGETQFAQEDGKQPQLLWLPAGTNVLEVMSTDCKINLKMELAL
jgi:hypothetical protein